MSGTWTPIPIQLGALPASRRRFYTVLEIYAAVHRYRTEFLAGRRSRDRLYRQYSEGRPNIPSLNTILRIGKLDELLQEVETPGWEERVKTYPDPRTPSPELVQQRRVDRIRARTAKPDPQRVLRIITERGSASSQEISQALERPVSTVRGYLALLRRAGLIKPTCPTQSRKQRYVLTRARCDATTNGAV